MTFGKSEWLVLSFPVDRAGVPAALSAAERSVALAVVRGLSNAEIASERGTSMRTVANQVASIFRKLGAHSRLDLARMLRAGE